MAQTVTDNADLGVLKHARSTLAKSSTWQSWVSAANATEAENHIYLFGPDPPKPWSSSTSFALRDVLDVRDGWAFECTSAGTTGSSEPDWGAAADDETIDDGTVEWTARQLSGSTTPDQYRLKLVRPMAIFGFGQNLQIANRTGELSGRILLVIESDIPAEYLYTYEAAYIWFWNKLSDLRSDLTSLIGSPGNLEADSHRVRAFDRAEPEETDRQGDFMQAMLQISMGGVA